MTPEENPLPEQDPPSDKKIPDGVEFPAADDLPEDFTPLIRADDLSSPSRARRRRARRSIVVPGEDERLSLLSDLARRAVPSAGFFLLALLSGILLGAGYLLNAHALLLLGILAAPLLMPWVGFTLAAVTGGWRFLLQSLASLLVAFLLTFCTSALVGLINRAADFTKFHRAFDHARLWWTDLLIVALGAVLLEVAFVRSEKRPILSGLMVSYGFFLPLAAAGFGFGAGLEEVYPAGLYIFTAHFALATLMGGIVLFILRFKPVRVVGVLLPILIALLSLAALATITGFAGWVSQRLSPPEVEFSATPLSMASPTLGLPPSATPGIPSRTASPAPSREPSATFSPTSQPSYAVISAETGGGALMRAEPGTGTTVLTLLNGTLVEVLPEIRTVGTIPWVLVKLGDGRQGWVLQAVLTASAPPTATVTASNTPLVTP
jgi:hypothetical protein